jgi:hypothetical protein
MCFLVALGLGCGRQDAPNAKFQDGERMKDEAAAPAGQGGRGAANPGPGDVPRKIVYTANVDLDVGDFDKATEQLGTIREQYKGIVAKSYVTGSPGSPRNGNWTIRVPVDNFLAFMTAVEKIGELRSSKTDSEDITDKFYDLKAHIKTNKVEEEGLQKLLIEKAPSSKLEDLVAVRRELRAIRAEIEQQEGRLQRMDKESSLATVNIILNDHVGYVPANTPGFGTVVGRTFNGSLEVMLAVGRGIILTVVALAPWVVLLAIPGVPALLFLRRQLRQSPPAPKPPPGTPEAEAVTV